jgi:hypothetical protein
VKKLIILIALLFAIPFSAHAFNNSMIFDGDSGTEVEFGSRSYDGATPVGHFYRANGPFASPTRALEGDLIGGIGSRPHTGSGWATHSTAAIHWVAWEDITNSNQGSGMRFLTTPIGTDNTNRVSEMELSPSGYLTYKTGNTQVYKSSNVGNQVLATNTYAAVSYDAVEWDNRAQFNSGTPTRLTATVAGKYRVTATVNFEINGVGERVVNFRKNGNSTDRYGYQGVRALSTLHTQVTTTHTFDLAAGDYIQTFAYQTSGSNVSLLAEPATPTGIQRFSMEYIGK